MSQSPFKSGAQALEEFLNGLPDKDMRELTTAVLYKLELIKQGDEGFLEAMLLASAQEKAKQLVNLTGATGIAPWTADSNLYEDVDSAYEAEVDQVWSELISNEP